jgi:DNA (cytosine-5)-methyltransferase 1
LADEVEHLLPTPRTSDTNGTGQHGTGGLDLRTAVDLLPTPRALDSTGVRGRTPNRTDEANARAGTSLTDAVTHLLPTPTSRDHKGANQRHDETCLHGALLPTPRATDGTNGGPNQRGSSGDLMLPSAVMLLPTPRAQNGEDRNQTIRARDLDQPQNLENALARIGANTNPQSDDGNAPSDE